MNALQVILAIPTILQSITGVCRTIQAAVPDAPGTQKLSAAMALLQTGSDIADVVAKETPAIQAIIKIVVDAGWHKSAPAAAPATAA